MPDQPDGGPALAAAPPWRRLLLAISLVLMAFVLRVPVASVGPVLPEAARAIALSAAASSVLTTLPSLCFGIFSPLAAVLRRRIGIERGILAALLAIAAGTALRGIAEAPFLFGGQILACLGIAIVNVLLPGLVKQDFPGQAALMTGLYVTALCGGAAVAAAFTVPLRLAFGGSWAGALAVWAIPAVIAAALWAPNLPARVSASRAHRIVVRGLWRDALAWQLTLFMGLQSAFAYISFGWLAPMLRDRGLSARQAGFVLAANVLAQAVSSLVAPTLATRRRDQRAINLVAVVVCTLGFEACIFGPLSLAGLASTAFGLAQGALFAVGLTMIVLRAADAPVAAELSAMAQTIGYSVASLGPLAAGLLRGATGNWNAVGALGLAMGVALAAAGLGAGRAIQVRAVSAALPYAARSGSPASDSAKAASS